MEVLSAAMRMIGMGNPSCAALARGFAVLRILRAAPSRFSPLREDSSPDHSTSPLFARTTARPIPLEAAQ